MTEEKTNVLVTGIHWMGGGVGSIESAMERLFQSARDELMLTVYSISTRTDLLFDLLDISLGRGVQTKMVINRFEKQPRGVTGRLLDMANRYPHFLLHNFSGDEESDLHAKVIVADRKTAIVGSSNLSWRGMVTNYELAVWVEGETAIIVAQTVDRLLASKTVHRISSGA